MPVPAHTYAHTHAHAHTLLCTGGPAGGNILRADHSSLLCVGMEIFSGYTKLLKILRSSLRTVYQEILTILPFSKSLCIEVSSRDSFKSLIILLKFTVSFYAFLYQNYFNE